MSRRGQRHHLIRMKSGPVLAEGKILDTLHFPSPTILSSLCRKPRIADRTMFYLESNLLSSAEDDKTLVTLTEQAKDGHRRVVPLWWENYCAGSGSITVIFPP